MSMGKTFVKWVGGKSKLLEEISSKYPQTIENVVFFIFLSKNCFIGLYRVNFKELFSVPFKNVKNFLICIEIVQASRMIKYGVTTVNCRRAFQGSAIAPFLRSHSFTTEQLLRPYNP